MVREASVNFWLFNVLLMGTPELAGSSTGQENPSFVPPLNIKRRTFEGLKAKYKK